MHQPPSVRLPSYRELYGLRPAVVLSCWSASGTLLCLTTGARAVTAVVDTFWVGTDPSWSGAAATLSDALGIVSLGALPVLTVLALTLTALVETTPPKDLPPWTTRERLRTAKVLAGNAVMGNDPWTNLLARVHAGVHLRWSGWLLSRSLVTGCLILSGLWSGSGVYLLVRGLRNEDPALMAIGLNTVLLFAGASALLLAGLPRHRRMREFCALYDAAHRQAVR
ncbi:hypothetical protein A6A08_03310 [Nocardiopsis sp. TSRI0078]|uniref:hypothetical protein n=1 Tax=unclassified Nocardiopsis TaxID=2649073 RepID=UPI00093E3F58|nr:hypothetical protein [Nocardiopsis sp. TSRI0078]OKI23802.1 hypothetical protein A6A08_03310 [Nocardiopsis sp. TSRI0078]